MLIIFTMLLVITIILIIAGSMDRAREEKNKNRAWYDRWQNVLCWSIICIVLSAVILGACWGTSYNSYIETRVFYDATREQYAGAVEVYQDHAVIDVGKAAFTDFKYQGYQDNISDYVKSLRNSIIKYNKKIVAKRTMGKNIFFSWLIIEPADDMKIIKMSAPTASLQ